MWKSASTFILLNSAGHIFALRALKSGQTLEAAQFPNFPFDTGFGASTQSRGGASPHVQQGKQTAVEPTKAPTTPFDWAKSFQDGYDQGVEQTKQQQKARNKGRSVDIYEGLMDPSNWETAASQTQAKPAENSDLDTWTKFFPNPQQSANQAAPVQTQPQNAATPAQPAQVAPETAQNGQFDWTKFLPSVTVTVGQPAPQANEANVKPATPAPRPPEEIPEIV